MSFIQRLNFFILWIPKIHQFTRELGSAKEGPLRGTLLPNIYPKIYLARKFLGVPGIPPWQKEGLILAWPGFNFSGGKKKLFIGQKGEGLG